MDKLFDWLMKMNIRKMIWKSFLDREIIDVNNGRFVPFDDLSDEEKVFDRECREDIDQQWYFRIDPIRWISMENFEFVNEKRMFH